MQITKPRKKGSHHFSHCAIVFFKEGEVDVVIHSRAPMWSAALYIKAATKKDGKERFAEKAVLRQ